MPQTSVQVAVVGGGLAGLFTTSELIRSGVEDILVLEKAPEPGGVIRTIQRDGYMLEPAAGTLLLPHPHLSPLLERTRVKVRPAEPEAGLRHVYTRGRMVSLPTSPRAIFAPLVPFTAKLRGALEPFVRTGPGSPDESLDSFLRRRVGSGLGRMLAWVAASGVFAGDPTRLSAAACFPSLTALEEEAGSIVRGGLRRLRHRSPGSSRPMSHLPEGGMTALAETLARSLGDRFRGGFEVNSIIRGPSGWLLEGAEPIRADRVVLAVSPRVAAPLVGGDLGLSLAQSVNAPVVVVGLGGPAGSVQLPAGFGVITGPDESFATRGILFESSYAPSRAPEGHHLAKVIAGGAVRPDVADWGDDQVLETVIKEMTRVLGSDATPSFTEIIRHVPGIPQYQVGHLSWLGELDRMLAGMPGLHLTGWGYRGVGVAHVASDAVSVARQIAG